MRQTLGHAPFPQAGTTSRSAVARVLVIVAASTLFVAWLAISRPLDRHDLTVVNPTACSLWIDVSRGDGSGTIDLGPTPTSTAWREPAVLDRGDLWRFRFWRGGELLGSEVRSAAQLEAAGWRYEVPDRADLDRGCA